MNRRIEREKRTVSLMIGMYCEKHHLKTNEFCEDCHSLNSYSINQTDNCRFGTEKPVCSLCPVHCYKKEKREQIREVMKYAGPKMIFRHPYLSIMHLYDKQKSIK